MKRVAILTALLATFVFAAAFAGKSTGNISGRVLSDNHEPLSFANVLLFSTEDSLLVKAEYSAEDGSFEMLNIPAGNYRLSISYVGLPEFATDPFELAAGQNLRLPEIILSGEGIELTEATVTARRPLVEALPDKMVFNVEGSINAAGNNALELLRKAPGVVVDNNDNIMLNGKSGVRIYIDDRPSRLGSRDLAAYLKTLPADNIERIELIANPGSKYEAEGNAGIINIRLKKDKRLGANANTSLGYGIGLKQQYSGSVNGNFRNKALNTFGSYSYWRGDNANHQNIYREQEGQSFDHRSTGEGYYQSQNFKLGADFFLNDFNTIGILADGSRVETGWNNKSFTAIGQMGSPVVDSALIAGMENEQTFGNYNFNINYRFDNTKGVVWNIDADYGFFKNRSDEFQSNEYRMGEGGEGSAVSGQKFYSTDAATGVNIATFKADHERPFLKGQLGAGVKFSHVKTDNDFNFFRLIENKPVEDIERSNRFVYKENVNAGYANYSRPLGKFAIQGGLRMEQTNSDGKLTAMKPGNEAPVRLHYFDFFPSGGFTWTPDPKHSLQLIYSRRIDRPSYEDLNPFEERLDELTLQKGNPFLKPQYTSKFQLNHTFLQTYNTSLSYSRTTDLITKIVDIDSRNSAATFITLQNLTSQNNLSLSFSAPVQITNWWDLFSNLLGYYQHNEADFGSGKIIDLKAVSFNGYVQNTFSLPHDMSVEVSGWYHSPSIWVGNFKMAAKWSMDMGVQKKLLKGKGNLKVTVSDIFKTNNWQGDGRFGNLYMKINGDYDSRRVRVYFTYLFGNEQVKAARNRSTGLEEERRRVGENK